MAREYRKLSALDQQRIRLIVEMFSGVTANKIARLFPHLKAQAVHAFMKSDRLQLPAPPAQRILFSPQEDQRLLELFAEMGDKYHSISRIISREGIKRSASTVFGRLRKLRGEKGPTSSGGAFLPALAIGPGEAGGSYPTQPPHNFPEAQP